LKRIFSFAAACAVAALPAFGQDCKPVPRPPLEAAASNEMRVVAESYDRLAKVVASPPPLFLCESKILNAVTRPGQIVISAGLVRALHSDPDAVAAVLSHELGHVIQNHIWKRGVEIDNALADASREWGRRVDAGADRRAAAISVLTSTIKRVAEFSKTEEREADDTGFSISVKAGFDPNGARRVFATLMESGQPALASYFDMHPGLAERLDYSVRLADNESYRRRAAESLVKGDAKELFKVVAEWRTAMPDSGAAAYYLGAWALMTHSPPEFASQAFEDAVSNFEGEGLSQASQMYQDESQMALVSLCVSLYREDRKVETLACLQRLRDPKQVEFFRQVTGWNDFILVGPVPERQRTRRVLSGASDGDSAVLTNCSHIAKANGLKAVKPWKGLRAESRGEESDVTMVCSPDFCDCWPKEETGTNTAAPAR
jgi:hypothetical protein